MRKPLKERIEDFNKEADLISGEKPKEYEQWEKDLIKNHSLELLYYASDNDNEVENLLKAIRQLLKAERERIIKDLDKIILNQMSKFASTKISERKGAFHELYEIRKILSTLKK